MLDFFNILSGTVGIVSGILSLYFYFNDNEKKGFTRIMVIVFLVTNTIWYNTRKPKSGKIIANQETQSSEEATLREVRSDPLIARIDREMIFIDIKTKLKFTLQSVERDPFICYGVLTLPNEQKKTPKLAKFEKYIPTYFLHNKTCNVFQIEAMDSDADIIRVRIQEVENSYCK